MRSQLTGLSARQYTTQLEKWGYIKKPTYQRTPPTRPLPDTPKTPSIIPSHHLEPPSQAAQNTGTEPEPSHEQPEPIQTFSPGVLNVSSESTEAFRNSHINDTHENHGIVLNCGPGAPDSPEGNPRHQTVHDANLALNQMPLEEEMQSLQISQSSEIPDRVAESTQTGPVKMLSSIFQNSFFELSTSPISEDAIVELVTASNFLFAAESYDDAFTISQITRQLGVHTNAHTSPVSTLLIDSTPAWLVIAVNLARSARHPEHFKDLSRFLKQMAAENLDLHTHNKDCCLLYAYLGDIAYRFSGHSRAGNAAAEFWAKVRSMAPCARYLITRHIIAPAIEEVMAGLSHDQPGFLALKTFQESLCVPSESVRSYTDQGLASKDVRVVLIWCSKMLARHEFDFMVSNVDTVFWKQQKGLQENDIEQFEMLVVYCYLCERFWHADRLDRAKVPSTLLDPDINSALERLHQHLGISREDIIAAVVSSIDVTRPVSGYWPERSTLPPRFQAGIESLCHQSTLNSVGYEHGTPKLTLDELMEQYRWPGRSTQPLGRFQNSRYGQCVRTFLQEFLSVSFELDLSARLQQVDKCFRVGHRGSGSIGASQTARSSQMSNDFAAFKATVRPASGTSAMSLTESLEVPTAGLNDLLSDTSSTRKILSYSFSIESVRSQSTMSISGSSIASKRPYFDPENSQPSALPETVQAMEPVPEMAKEVRQRSRVLGVARRMLNFGSGSR